jgi:hypothetical protein
MASGVGTLLSIAVLHVVVQHSWRWAPFLWSVAICCMGALVVRMALATVLRLPGLPAARRTRLRHRQILNPYLWIGSGLTGGAMAAMYGLDWISVALGVYVALTAGGWVVAYTVLRRRSESNPSAGDESTTL